MLKRFLIGFTYTLLSITGVLMLSVQPASAYTDYNDCVSQRSTQMNPSGGLSASDLTTIQTSCGQEFPGQGSSSSRTQSSATDSQASTQTSSTPTENASATGSENISNSSRSFGGFINDTRGIPTLDPTQYINYYQGSSFSRLTSSRDAFGFLTSFALSFIGMVAIIFLIYAGFVYITANGEQAKIDKAKKLIWGTIIGILIIFSVYATVATLLNISAAVNPGVNIGPLNVGPGGTTLRLP